MISGIFVLDDLWINDFDKYICFFFVFINRSAKLILQDLIRLGKDDKIYAVDNIWTIVYLNKLGMKKREKVYFA